MADTLGGMFRTSLTSLRLAAVALTGLVAVGGLTACSNGSDAVTDVNPKAAAEVLQESGTTVIDVRTSAEYASGHLPGAVNIDAEAATFEDQVEQLPKDAQYLVYCHSGNRSGVATDEMAKLGFTDVYDLQGGIVAWQADGGQLVTD